MRPDHVPQNALALRGEAELPRHSWFCLPDLSVALVGAFRAMPPASPMDAEDLWRGDYHARQLAMARWALETFPDAPANVVRDEALELEAARGRFTAHRREARVDVSNAEFLPAYRARRAWRASLDPERLRALGAAAPEAADALLYFEDIACHPAIAHTLIQRCFPGADVELHTLVLVARDGRGGQSAYAAWGAFLLGATLLAVVSRPTPDERFGRGVDFRDLLRCYYDDVVQRYYAAWDLDGGTLLYSADGGDVRDASTA